MRPFIIRVTLSKYTTKTIWSSTTYKYYNALSKYNLKKIINKYLQECIV